MLVLYTDTDCDVSPETAKKWGYKGLISMPYSIDTKAVSPYVDFNEFNYHEYYDMLRNGVIPVTNAVSESQYIDYFEKEFKDGNDILYVHFSASMSGSFNSMNNALKVLYERYPGRKLYSLDTKGITVISYAIAEQVSILFKKGKTADEILKWAETEIQHWAMYFFADDLKFFKHSGRVGGLSATMGTILGVRPIIYMSAEGKMESIDKVKGQKNAISYLLNKTEEIGDNVASYKIYIGHTDAGGIVDKLTDRLYEKYGKGISIDTVITNPTAGAHAGPDGVGICFHAKHR